MSEIDLAKQNGENISRIRCHDGEKLWVCTRCFSASRKLRNLRHVARCRNRPIPLEALGFDPGVAEGAERASDKWLKDNG
jgi:hypothetical protein